MRKVILLMHVSLDGFVAGPNGEMDWIRLDDELFDDVAAVAQTADTALYGRVTYQMMEAYWPTAGDSPDASKHDIEHSRWANEALKLVFSRTLTTTTWQNTRIVHDHIAEEIGKLKAQPGKNLLMLGSASTAHTFMRLGLIDEFYINLNPVVLGGGLPLFADLQDKLEMELVSAKSYPSGMVGLHYRRA